MNATSLTAKLILEIDSFETGGIPEDCVAIKADALINFHTQRARMIADAHAAVRTLVPDANVFVSLSWISGDDITFFSEHPTRAYLLRSTFAGEPLLTMNTEKNASHSVIVWQVLPGVRLLSPTWFVVAGGRTIADRFNQNRYAKAVNHDSILRDLFEGFCRQPGKPVDLGLLLKNLNARGSTL